MFLLGCGGSGLSNSPMQVVATYEGRISGISAAGRPLTGKMSLVVSADYSASMTVYDAASRVLGNLTGRVNAETGIGALKDSAGKMVFAGYFSPNSDFHLNRNLVGGTLPGVPSANGTWRNDQNGSFGKWSTLVPTIAAPLTQSQASALAASAPGILVPAAYGPVNTQFLTCPAGVAAPIVGIGPNGWGMFSYADPSGNTFIVVIKNYPPGNGLWTPNTSFIYASLMAPDCNLAFVSSWPSASATLADIGPYGFLDLPSG